MTWREWVATLRGDEYKQCQMMDMNDSGKGFAEIADKIEYYCLDKGL